MPELSVIVPTYNERPNLGLLIRSLGAALGPLDYEIVIVDDDSPDGTAALARSFAQCDSRIRVLQRIRRKGLSSAVVEGMLATSSPYLAVIDADMQHDESILPQMLAKLKNEDLDVVIGSRHVSGGSMGDFARHRVMLSQLGRMLSRAACRTTVSDPMSGYFVTTRRYFHEIVHSLSSVGFKLLLDVIASSRRQVRLGEVGYTFRNRLHGDSKLDIVVALEYGQLLLDKLTRGWIPVGYLVFSLIGATGLLVNIVLAYALLHVSSLSFNVAQAAAGFLVIALNFVLNNRLTFRSARLRGARATQGFFLFYAACSIGLLFNLTAARGLRDFGVPLYVASFTGVVVGSVWNYWVTSLFVWQINRRRGVNLKEAYVPGNWMGAIEAQLRPNVN